MKVSITLDATIKRTRSEGGAAVVRVVAMRFALAPAGNLRLAEDGLPPEPGVSLRPNYGFVNEERIVLEGQA
jgi:hypothetical protein